jgi:hypothetical protein
MADFGPGAASEYRLSLTCLFYNRPVVSATVRPERGSYANSLHQAHLHAISLIQSPTTRPVGRAFSRRPASC